MNEKLLKLAEEKSINIHVYEGEYSHHETEYTFSQSGMVALLELVASTVPDELVTRFLCWKLPKGFAPDGGIVFDKHQNHHFTPTGTNLFTADQAKQMFEYLLEGEPVALQIRTDNKEVLVNLLKDKAELIEYAKYLKNALIRIYDAQHSGLNKNILSTVGMANVAEDALSIPQPKCLKGQI